MSWRIDSSAGAAIWDSQPISDSDLALRDEEIQWLMAHQRTGWKLINGRLARSGDLVANVGQYTSLAAYPPASASGFLANVASLNGEASLWTTALYTPWLANTLVAPSAWRIHAAWQTTTSTSPGNLTLNPRIGSVAAGSSSTGGIALGADGTAVTLTASITTNWSLVGNLTVDVVGAPGTNSKCIGDFRCIAKPATTGTGPATINDLFGYTQAAFDSSIASGFVLGMANTVTTITYAPMVIHWISF